VLNIGAQYDIVNS